MKIIGLLAFSMGMMGWVQAQTPSAEKYAAHITGARLQQHLTIIAGEAMEGRETGTEGQRKAAAYIENEFKTTGLLKVPGQSGYQQFFPLYQDSLMKSNFTVGGTPAVYGTDFISPANANENRTFNARKWVWVGYGIEDENYSDYQQLNVKGKIVVFFLGEPKANGLFLVTGTKSGSKWSYPGLSEKLRLAAQKGAVGALVISPNQALFASKAIDNSKQTNPYFLSIDAKKNDINYVLLSHGFAQTILGSSFDSLLNLAKASQPFKTNGTIHKISIKFAFQKQQRIIQASNVIGIVEGTDKKEEYVFLTGHYDHLGKRDGKIYYGADDDGSGTCAVITMAEAFAKAKAEGHGPRRTVVFMTVSGEEKGLWGSEYYSDHPLLPLDKTTVDLNTDMVGRVDTERKLADTLNYVYVIGHDKISSDLPVINEGANNQFTQLTLDYKFDDPNDPERIYFRSDHYNFARKGVPVLFFYDGMLKADYHKPTDTVDKINWSLYEKRVRMIFYTAWEMANRDAMLVRDKPLTTGTR